MRFKIKNLLLIILICNFSTISKSANEDDIYKKYNRKSVEFIKFNKVKISSSKLRKI